MSLVFGRAPGLGFGWEPPPTGPPIAATDAVAAALEPIDGEQHWYTDATSGGWVMMTQYERGVRVALDGRILNVYPPDLVMELVARARDADALLAWLDASDVVAVVIERELPENDVLGLADTRWALVWVDEGTYGYVRRDRLAASAAELRCFRHMTSPAAQDAWFARLARGEVSMACFCDDVARLQSALPPEDGPLS